jgi:LemA protein
MSITTVIILASAAIAIGYAIGLYNRLVNVKNQVSQAWANIDVILKQRHDELPKLVEVCKQYKEFEAATLEKVIAARNGVQEARLNHDIPGVGKAESILRAGLGQIYAVAEAYPDLKSNNNFMQLQNRVSGLENAIADRRELYNSAVNINNVAVEEFPAVLIASPLGFQKHNLLEFSAEETSDVDIKGLFNS